MSKLTLVCPTDPAQPAPSLRRLEGEALAAIAEHLRDQALALPGESEIRTELLESAEAYLMLAKLRGARPAALRLVGTTA